MKQTPLLFIGFFLITTTAVGQDTKPNLDSLLRLVAGLEQEIKAIDKKLGEVKNEIIRLSGTNPETKTKSSSKEDRFTELVKKYGESDATLIKNKGYRIGMTKEMLLESLGSPKTQSAMKLGNSVHESFRYESGGKQINIDLKDGILTSFREY